MRKITEFKTISSETEIAYIAGIIDSLATFSIKKSIAPKHIIWKADLLVRTTDHRIIEFLNESFGVNNCRDEKKKLEEYTHEKWEDRPRTKAVKTFVCAGAFLDYVLSIVTPHLRFVRAKADIVARFRSTFNGLGCHPVAYETQELRDKIREEFRSLQRPRKVT